MPMVTSKKKNRMLAKRRGFTVLFQEGIPIQEMHIPLQDHKVTMGP